MSEDVISQPMMLALVEQLRVVERARGELVTEMLRLPKCPARDAMRTALVAFDAALDTMIEQTEQAVTHE